MSVVYDLTDDNFMMMAMKSYDSPHCITHEFDEDFKRIKYIKRLVGRYLSNDDLKERLILNHTIILSNAFGVDFTTRMLFFKTDSEYHSTLKTFLLYLNYLPKEGSIRYLKGKTFDITGIPVDLKVAEVLRGI